MQEWQIAVDCVVKKICVLNSFVQYLLWFCLMQGILGYGGKNAKIGKMGSWTSRKVGEKDKAHD